MATNIPTPGPAEFLATLA